MSTEGPTQLSTQLWMVVWMDVDKVVGSDSGRLAADNGRHDDRP